MKVVFAGTPEFAAIALKALHNAGFEIVLVLTQPDRPAGRGMQMHTSAVKQFALQHQIPVAQPISLRLDGKYPDDAQQAHALLKDTPHEVMVVAAYGLILPLSVLKIPPMGCVNIHGSLLPRWRGAAPIHRAIENGDTATGITIMQMELGLDTGPMLAIESIPIATNDSTATLHDKLAKLGGTMIVEVLREMQHGSLTATVQPEQGVTYAAKINKGEASLDFHLTAQTLARKIRAFNPSPGTHANLAGATIKIWHAEVVEGIARKTVSGQIISANAHEGILVACASGDSVLRLTELQKPGGKRLPTVEFLKGFPINPGQIFLP